MVVKVYYGLENINCIAVNYYDNEQEFMQDKNNYNDILSASVFDDNGNFIKELDI